jgi:hypothetical protein
MTIDEELDLLTDHLRRLKIEYEIFFNGASKKPPVDLRSRVEFIIKKYGDTQKLNAHQRFRYNTLTGKFSVFSDLWRNRMRTKEEGNLRRPRLNAASAQASVPPSRNREVLFKEIIVNPRSEHAKILRLYGALKECQAMFGETKPVPHLDQFERFISQKTSQLMHAEHCSRVAFMIVRVNEQIKFHAAPLRGKAEGANL